MGDTDEIFRKEGAVIGIPPDPPRREIWTGRTPNATPAALERRDRPATGSAPQHSRPRAATKLDEIRRRIPAQQSSGEHERPAFSLPSWQRLHRPGVDARRRSAVGGMESRAD